MWKRYILTIIQVLVCVFVNAQSTEFGTLTINDGLSSGLVSCIYKDSRGYVYLGNSVGVDRFDGTYVENALFPNKDSKKISWVSAMIDEDDQHLLVGNVNGLWRLDKLSNTLTRIYQEKIDFGVNTLVRSNTGVIYIGTSRGLFSLDPKKHKLQELHLDSRLIHGQFNVVSLGILQTKNKESLWVAFPHGLLLHESNGHNTYYPCAEGKLSQMAVSQTGRIFITVNGRGVHEFNVVKKCFKPYKFSKYQINDLSCVDGHLLVAIELYGAVDVDLKTDSIAEIYSNTSNHKIRYNSVRTFYRDDLGVNWFGYSFFGVDYTYFMHRIFRNYNIPGVFDSGNYQVRSFLLDGNRVLLGTRNGLYVTNKQTRTVRYFSPEQLGSPLVTQIIKHGNKYYIATMDAGVKVMDASSLSFNESPLQTVLGRANVYQIVASDDGSLWFATSSGLFRYWPQTGLTNHYNSRNSQLPDDEVFCIGVDILGRCWASTRGGICLVDLSSGEITSNNIPRRLTELGYLSIIISGNGISAFIPQVGFPLCFDLNSHSFKAIRFSIQNETPTSLYLYKCAHNQYIYATDRGLYYGIGDDFRSFGFVDGLPSLFFQSRNMCVDNKGFFWTATNQGLAYARVKDMAHKSYPHIPIKLSEVVTDHWLSQTEVNEVNFSGRLKLSRTSNSLAISFSPLMYSNVKGIRYRYKLEGYDDWHLATHQNAITYNDLPAGTYQLHIEAIGMPEINATITVVVYLLWSFILTGIIIIMVVSLIIYILYCKWKHLPYFWERFFPKPEKYQRSSISKEEVAHIVKNLKSLMEEKKLYLNPNLQMSDLAKAVGCKQYALSQVFSQYLKRTYYDFISEYRIKEFQRRVADPQFSKFTINALSEQCGFRSRSTFLLAFKKYTGMSPKDYIKHLQDN
jgi:ligand-binding sensor domain-containing protein/AraC-like DNA-binding protein